jgi:hypothetical protein
MRQKYSEMTDEYLVLLDLGWFYLPTTEVHLCKSFELEMSNHNTHQ